MVKVNAWQRGLLIFGAAVMFLGVFSTLDHGVDSASVFLYLVVLLYLVVMFAFLFIAFQSRGERK